MKVLALVLIAVMLAIGSVSAQEGAGSAEEVAVEETAPGCPVTLMTKDCMKCHAMVIEDGKPKFGLKEIPLAAAYSMKPYSMNIVKDNGEIAAYMLVDNINPDQFRDVSHYLYLHPEFKKLIIEVQSNGGSVLGAWRIVGIIEEMRKSGIEIETRCYGKALSAGGIIFIAGDFGKRRISSHAEVMIHKVWQFEQFAVSDPDNTEDKADMLKHLQANINRFFEERTDLTAEIINAKSLHKMWWFTGQEAIAHGVADSLIGEK